MGFVHLHLHSEYSLLDGGCKIERLVLKAKELGQKSIALTDHCNLFGVVKFYNACEKYGVKPIIGCEIVVNLDFLNEDFDVFKNNSFHLTVLCENLVGYRNLNRIIYKSFSNNFSKTPIVDFSYFEKNCEGLIVLSGCLFGAISFFLLNNRFELALFVAEKFALAVKKDNFFLEIQNHKTEEEEKIKNLIVELAKKTNIPLVATNNVHYVNKEDFKVQRLLSCIRKNTILDEKTFTGLKTKEFYLKTEEEMRGLFPQFEEAIENTVKIADRCSFKFEFLSPKIPKFFSENVKDSEEFFIEKAKEGLILKYGENVESSVLERFFYEIDVIVKMNFVDYFLIVYDYVNYARKIGVLVGPGRGSGAGSLVAYCLNITSIDPIKYGLLFERFLNVDRKTMPDFDVDFCNERRQEVIDYVFKKYGSLRVAQIVTFGTLAAKAAVRDVGRVVGAEIGDVNRIVDLISGKPGTKLKEALEDSLKLRNMVQTNGKFKRLFEAALMVEGFKRNISIHAAALVVSNEELINCVPLMKNEEGVVLTQFPMEDVSGLGLLKMDFLGLRNLTIIGEAEKLIKDRVKNFSVENVNLEDDETFEMLSQGDSVSVFQLESLGIRKLLKKVKPKKLEDLMAVLALYRPGPSQFIESFVENRNNPKKIKYATEQMKKILDSTSGVILYQEQVMQIFREIAGYSFGRIDLIRKAISKKDAETMKKEREVFIFGTGENCEEGFKVVGAVKNGVDKKIAEIIFEKISKFAAYAFNKSHAASYSIISYKTAYLKRHFFVEYMVSVLNSVITNRKKLLEYLVECKKNGVKFLPLNVNGSNLLFSVAGKNLINFSFLAVKNVGKKFAEDLIKNREDFGDFKSFRDFVYRVKDLNKISVQSLVFCGAFDGLGVSRKNIISNYEKMVKNSYNFQIGGQLSLVSNFKEEETLNYSENAEYGQFEMRQMETDLIGISFDELNDEIRSDYDVFKEEVEGLKNKKIKIEGLVENFRLVSKKTGEQFVVLKFLTEYGLFECFVSLKVLKRFDEKLVKNLAVCLFGTFYFNSRKKVVFVEKIAKFEGPFCLAIKLKVDCLDRMEKVLKILKEKAGECCVIFFDESSRTYFRNKRSLRVEISEGLIENLEDLVGKDCVKLKKLKDN